MARSSIRTLRNVIQRFVTPATTGEGSKSIKMSEHVASSQHTAMSISQQKLVQTDWITFVAALATGMDVSIDIKSNNAIEVGWCVASYH